MINNIQFLRAFAAINVVLFHILEIGPSYSVSVNYLGIMREWGRNGVDIFFVISGFVMVYTQLTSGKSVIQFIRSRIIRIVPIYWLLTTCLVVIFIVLPNLFREMELTTSRVYSSYLFISQINVGEHPVLYPGWTLEWEMLFYFIFALVIATKNRVIGPAIASSLLFAIALTFDQLLVMEFFFGMCIGIAKQRLQINNNIGLLILTIGLIALLSSIDKNIDQYERLFIFGIPAFLIVLGAIFTKQLNNKFLEYLGSASYSIYLIQTFTIPAFYKLSSSLLVGIHGDVLVITGLILSVGFGCFVYSFIEAPVTKKLKSLTAPI